MQLFLEYSASRNFTKKLPLKIFIVLRKNLEMLIGKKEGFEP
jgi:hypothetical protein